MRTYIKIFQSEDKYATSNAANDWAKMHNAEILSADLSIREWQYARRDDYYLTVVFREV